MDNCENFRIARSATKVITRSSCVREVILFGLTVKGTLHPDSDIDIVVDVNTKSLSQRVAVTEGIIGDLEGDGKSVVLHYNEGSHKGPWKKIIHLGVYNGKEYFPPGAIREGVVLFPKTEESK